MPDTREIGITDARSTFAELVNGAVRGRVAYITSHGRRVAAVVPLQLAQQTCSFCDEPTEDWTRGSGGVIACPDCLSNGEPATD